MCSPFWVVSRCGICFSPSLGCPLGGFLRFYSAPFVVWGGIAVPFLGGRLWGLSSGGGLALLLLFRGFRSRCFVLGILSRQNMFLLALLCCRCALFKGPFLVLGFFSALIIIALGVYVVRGVPSITGDSLPSITRVCLAVAV